MSERRIDRPNGSAGLSARRRERGVSLVETAMALAVVAVAAMTALSVLIASLELDATNRETKAAFDAARIRLETVRAEPFDRVVRSFNADPADDPDGAGTAAGAAFAVPTLPALATGTTTHGEVLLPVDGGGRIREDLTVPELGLPRDLNGDGVVDSADHTADAIVLPVAVRVRWSGATGDRTSVLAIVLRQ